ncbi:hypothetical protein BH24ACT5_BH24ACT5_18950 [soil metagenome]
MKLDDRDRGRLLLVSVATLVALPTIWLVNRNEDGAGSSRPNVAAVGLDPGDGDGVVASPLAVDTADPMGAPGPIYLEAATTVAPPPAPEVAVGTEADAMVGAASGTYRNSVSGSTCLYNGTGYGERVTVVNVANGRSTECTTSPLAGGVVDVVVLSASRFARIADLTAAPVHVEIRQ